MGPKRATRATKGSANKETEPPSEAPLPQLISKVNEQRRIFILPSSLSPEARILSLPHPATSRKSRYFFCPIKGLFEFTKVGVPLNDLRSWLITQSSATYHIENESIPDTISAVSNEDNPHQDYVLESPDLFLATPIDPVFFLMPLFQSSAKSTKASFRLDDDYVDLLTESSPELAPAFRLPGFRALLFSRLRSVSDVQQFGEDVLFKPNDQYLAKLLLEKSRNMIKDDVWPTSMEQAFVEKQLEIPIAPISNQNPQLLTPEQSMVSSDIDSQNSEVPIDDADAPDTSSRQISDLPSSNVSPLVKELMRLRVALNYLMSSYLPKDLAPRILERTSSDGLVNFTPLEEHLQKVKDANAQVHALRSLSDNISRKRSALDDDEALEVRAEKKRKNEEEEKKKKAQSRGIKELKKVDTSGMKKLSSFFTKSAGTTKS